MKETIKIIIIMRGKSHRKTMQKSKTEHTHTKLKQKTTALIPTVAITSLVFFPKNQIPYFSEIKKSIVNII